MVACRLRQPAPDTHRSRSRVAQFNISQVDDQLVARLIDLGSHNGFSLSVLTRPRTSTQGAAAVADPGGADPELVPVPGGEQRVGVEVPW